MLSAELVVLELVSEVVVCSLEQAGSASMSAAAVAAMDIRIIRRIKILQKL